MRLLILFTFLLNNILFSQVTTAVAPLNIGNTWVYKSSIAGVYDTTKYEVTDSVRKMNGIDFYLVRSGKNLEYGSYMGVSEDNYFVRYDTTIIDSLYRYFLLTPKVGYTWSQKWKNTESNPIYSTIADTFTTNVLGSPKLIYVVSRSDSGLIGSTEYWTKEYGLVAASYEQAGDNLLGCVINGKLYGDTTVTGINWAQLKPNSYELFPNYPNPFNPSTTISWEMPRGDNVIINIYDMLGRKIEVLTNSFYGPGKHKILFSADGLASGTYLYQISIKNYVQTKKMILIK